MNPKLAASLETELIAPLERFSRSDLERAGGKAANLGELIRGGFPAPPGFVVTTAAYDRFVAYNGLRQVIRLTLNEPDLDGAPILAAFEAATIPPEIEHSLLAAYRELGQGPVAVRSSATAEDLPEAAFAGQQDTYLNVLGPEALLEAVRKCWASLWNGRAIAYRQRQGVDQQAVKLAVVVQRMVMAEAAGVMFTANPVTGARDEIVVDGSPGLGEAVVSGLVTPDHIVLRRRRWGWNIAERQPGRREVIIRALPEGGTEQIEGTAGYKAMPAWVYRRLARLGAAIQRYFGSPQDVEWAWAHGKVFILQARPITALPTPLVRANKVQRLVAANFGELFSVRPYPLDMDTWIPALSGALEPIFELLGLDWGLERLFEQEDGVVVGFNGILPRPTWRVVLAPARLLRRILRYNPLHWEADPLLAETRARVRELESRDQTVLSWEQLLGAVYAAREIPFLAGGELRQRYFPRAAFAAARLRLLLGLMGRMNRLGALLSDVENKTLEVNRALEALAHQVRSDPGLAQTFSSHSADALQQVLERQPEGGAFLAELEAFFDCFGHREAVISTVRQPTWKDAPEVVLGIVKSFAAHPPPIQSAEAARQAARDELLQHLLQHRLLRIAPLRSAFLEILAEARTLFQIREDTHFYATLPMPLFRRTFLEMGGRLVQAGLFENPEDVFYLQLKELEHIRGKLPMPESLAAELHAKVIRRKERHARLATTPLVDPRLFLQTAPLGEALLRGMPGSPGVADGPVCIVRDGFEFDKLAPGDVLVAPFTNPSWTPLFQRAAAVVVDTGSLGSHAAIVAREYGIPAVMSTVNGTQTLRDGERIRVDGTQGAVFGVPPEGTDPQASD